MPKSMNVGQWIVTIILASILVIVLAALAPTFISGLHSFQNATGTTIPLATIVTLLLVVGVLLLFVFAFLPEHMGGRHRGT